MTLALTKPTSNRRQNPPQRPNPPPNRPRPVAEDPFDLDSDLLPDDAVMQGGGSFSQDPSDEELEESRC